MLSPASGRSPGARPGPEAAQSGFNRRPQGSRSACPRAGTGHLGGAGPRQPQYTDAAAPPAGYQAQAPHPGKCNLASAHFCRVEGPSPLGPDSPPLEVYLSDKTYQRGSWRPVCTSGAPGTLPAKCGGQRLGQSCGRQVGKESGARETMVLKAGGSGEQFFSSVFLTAFCKFCWCLFLGRGGGVGRGRACAPVGWGEGGGWVGQRGSLWDGRPFLPLNVFGSLELIRGGV